MKKYFKIIFILAAIIFALTACGIAYLIIKFPVTIAVENIKVQPTTERLNRGQYLVEHVVGCIDCHSQRDFSKYSGPIVEGTIGMGGFEFNRRLAGVPGSIYAKNITPAGIGDYSDGELLRVLTTGITKNNEALFPMMPYQHYGNGVSREDLYSIIAYIKTLKPIVNKIPDRQLNFPMNLIVNTIPSPAYIPSSIPSVTDTVAYGKYMVNAAGCLDCHTRFIKGKPEAGMEYAGGFEFTFPNGDVITTANLTPDLNTGIGALSKENFIAKFKTFDNAAARNISVGDHTKNTVMPWTALAGMSEQDLGAIYTFLRSLKPIERKIDSFRPGN